MQLDKYPVKFDFRHEVYLFYSDGPKGLIKKIIMCQIIEPGLFNLSFGDWDDGAQWFKDFARSNNGDRDKVLATVASTVFDFFAFHPNAKIFAKGTTPAKTRLYQMGINVNWKEISKFLEIHGYINGGWEKFKRYKNYDAFIIWPKK